jgi:hypothetical protein
MADKVNLQIDQGTTFAADFIVSTGSNNTPVALNGYTGAGQIRKNYTSAAFIPFTITVNANGVVRAALSANQTTSLTEGRYVYDIEITNPAAEVTRLVEGVVTVTPEVTR